jgi:protein phosphatase
MEIRYAYQTDKGVRQVNQDFVRAVSETENAAGYDVEHCGALFAVADGVGGHQAGEVAARMACEGLAQYYADARAREVATRQTVLQEVFAEINRAVFRKSVSANEFFGMGTTLTVMVVSDENGGTAHIAHIGDSRIYRLRGDELAMLTRDHTEVQKLVDKGELTLEQAKTYSRSQWLTEAIGAEPQLETLYERVEPALPGDRYLLCTDGLSNHLSDEQIEQTLRARTAPARACERLLQRALKAGSQDNLTALVIQVKPAGRSAR